MVLPAPVTVSAELLGLLVRERGIGELPVVLSGQARWYPAAVRAEFAEAARAECARIGWTNRRGVFDPDALAALEVLCRPRTAFYGWIHRDGTTIGALAAAIGKQAVLAVRDGEQVSLAPGRWSKLAETLVAQTPAVRAGRGTALRVRVEDVQAVDDRGRTLSASRVSSHRANSAVMAVKRLTELPELGTGELHAHLRDDLGRVRTPPQPLRYSDTPAGRYSITLDTDGYALIAPADRAALTDQLTRMLRSLTS